MLYTTRYFSYFGEDFKVECPTGSGTKLNLIEVSQFIAKRLCKIFLIDENGRRPCHGNKRRPKEYMTDI